MGIMKGTSEVVISHWECLKPRNSLDKVGMGKVLLDKNHPRNPEF